MVEIASIIMVCCLINSIDLASVIFFGLGIGILGAIDEMFYKRSNPIKGWTLLVIESLCMLIMSLSLLNETSIYMVLSLAFGICLFFFYI
ncbi:MAG: hypothetical protein IJD30_02475 [Clostridia bacterium]|nr:hypothetical protein [Clostridia bacterium]